MKARWPMGRFDLKIVATLILVAAGIFALSVVLVRDVLLWATTMARGQSQELVKELGRAAEFYRTLVETEKRLFAELSLRYRSTVQRKLRRGKPSAAHSAVLKSTLKTILVPALLLAIYACQGYASLAHWASWFLSMCAYVAFAYLAGDWFFVGYYLRLALLIGFTFATAVSSIGLTALPLILPF